MSEFIVPKYIYEKIEPGLHKLTGHYYFGYAEFAQNEKELDHPALEMLHFHAFISEVRSAYEGKGIESFILNSTLFALYEELLTPPSFFPPMSWIYAKTTDTGLREMLEKRTFIFGSPKKLWIVSIHKCQ